MKLNGWWFSQIVDRDSGNLYPIYILHSLFGVGVGVYFVVFKLLNLLAGDLGRPSCLVS